MSFTTTSSDENEFATQGIVGQQQRSRKPPTIRTIKRKTAAPNRSIKKIASHYEKTAQGIIQLNFIGDDIVRNRVTGEFGLSGTSDDNDNDSDDDDDSASDNNNSNSRRVGGRTLGRQMTTNDLGGVTTRRSVRGSSRLAGIPLNTNDGNDSRAEDESSGSDSDAEMQDDSDMAPKNDGAPSKKYKYDPAQSVAFLTSRDHVKAIGLLSRKGKIGKS